MIKVSTCSLMGARLWLEWRAPHRLKCANRRRVRNGSFCVVGYFSPCSYAYAVAADRLDSPSLVKMLLTWRATVFSLITSLSAIARFDLPEATRRSTSTSRAESPDTVFGRASRAA